MRRRPRMAWRRTTRRVQGGVGSGARQRCVTPCGWEERGEAGGGGGAVGRGGAEDRIGW